MEPRGYLEKTRRGTVLLDLGYVGNNGMTDMLQYIFFYIKCPGIVTKENAMSPTIKYKK